MASIRVRIRVLLICMGKWESFSFSRDAKNFFALSKNQLLWLLGIDFQVQMKSFHEVQSPIYHSNMKKCNILRKNESTEWLYLDPIFQEFASCSELFWGLKCHCSVTTSSKNILKVYLGPPWCLESLVIKQFVELVNS